MNQQNLRVIFTPKAEIVLERILKSNRLGESLDQYFDTVSHGGESREMIVRKATEVLAKKIVPETKLAELLQEHLGIAKQDAEKLLVSIKNELVPLLAIFPEEKFNDPVFREEVSRKVFGEEVLPFSKEIEVKNVEENARKMEKNLTAQKEEIITQDQPEEKKVKTVLPQEEKRGPDSYREPIE